MSKLLRVPKSIAGVATLTALVGLAAATFSPVPAEAQIMLGAYPGNGQTKDLLALEAKIGRKFAIDYHYLLIGTSQLNREIWDIANGRMPYVDLTISNSKVCFTAADIAAGKYDTQLTVQAQSFAALGSTVVVSFAAEMTDAKPTNDCFYGVGWNANATTIAAAGAAYVLAQQHVVSLFRSAGASNVQFAFAPEGLAYTVLVNNVAEWTLFYPGPATVDVLSVDHHYTGKLQEDFASDDVVLAFYNACVSVALPCMLGQTGANPGTEFVSSAEKSLPVLFPAIGAFIWNNAVYHLSGSVLTAFTAMGQDPNFQLMP
ncbi:MAG TPA: hypothetical protein VII49_10505 [Rhizomicrobium sp.]